MQFQNLSQLWFCLALLLVMCAPLGLAEIVSSLNPLETWRRYLIDRDDRRRAKARQPLELIGMELDLQRKGLENMNVKNEADLGRIQIASKTLELVRQAEASGTSVEDLASYLRVLDSDPRPDSGQQTLPSATGYGQLPPCAPGQALA